jgi:hypothetical protein
MRQVKRSAAFTLALVGTGAVGLYLATREANCRPTDPNQPPTCTSSRSGSGGTSSASLGYSGATNQGAVARGGFGNTGTSMSAHAGG